MIKIKGDILKLHQSNYPNSFIVIPTNLGYTKDSKNVMGRGLALAIKNKYPNIDLWYGQKCKERHLNNDNRHICLISNLRIILFATKPLNRDKPNLSWKQDSCLETIETSCKELKELIDTRLQPRDIYLPYVGCGNGNLDKSLVTPILEKYFSNNDKVFLVDYEQ